jgi:hypothetical protein
MVNSANFQELYILQFRLIGDSLTYLVESLTTATNTEFQNIVSYKVIAFVLFVVLIIFAYLALWLPFVIRISKDVSSFNLNI